jgi:hypothetical protein
MWRHLDGRRKMRTHDAKSRRAAEERVAGKAVHI